MKKIYGLALLFLMLLYAAPSHAWQKQLNLTLINKHHSKIFAALCYKDSADNWVVIGWYTIKGNGRVTVRNQVRSSNIYLYAESDGRNHTWTGGSGSRDRNYRVTTKPFKYISGSRPRGETRSVRFRLVDTKNYTNYNYTFSRPR